MGEPIEPTFHHVVVKLGGADKRLSKDQYDAMPLRDRVKLILNGGVTFYDADDKVLESSQALIRQAKA